MRRCLLDHMAIRDADEAIVDTRLRWTIGETSSRDIPVVETLTVVATAAVTPWPLVARRAFQKTGQE